MTRQTFVLHPHEEDEAVPFDRATPLRELEGAHVFLLGNSKPNAELLLRGLADRLCDRHGVEQITYLQKASAGRVAEEHHLTRMLAEAHAIITGIGD